MCKNNLKVSNYECSTYLQLEVVSNTIRPARLVKLVPKLSMAAPKWRTEFLWTYPFLVVEKNKKSVYNLVALSVGQ